MKKVVKISIAEISFTLDSDAYLSLKQYLDSLNSYYAKDPDGREIMADIEARIAELILEEQIYTKIVSKTLIDTIIAQLGTPDQIDDEAAGESEEFGFSGATGTAASPGSSFDASIPRRLHRSKEGRILGGVCSGLATYLNVKAIWVRVVFLLPLILTVFVRPFMQISFHGPLNFYWRSGQWSRGWFWIFVLIYIVLWAALPMARTPRQKLEARGEKITPASIRQNFQGAVNTPAGKKAASVMAELVTVVGRALLFIVKLMTAIIGSSFLFSAVLVLIGMFSAIINPESVAICNLNLTLLEGMTVLSPLWFALLIMLCMLIPLTVIGLALLSFTFGWRLGRVFFAVTLSLWAVAMIFSGVVALSNARFFHDVLPDRLELWDNGSWIYHRESNGEHHWEYYRYRRGGRRREIRDRFEDAGGSSVDAVEDSMMIVVKRDGVVPDTIAIPNDPGTVSVSISEDSVAVEVKDEIGNNKRIEVRRIE